MPHMTNGSVCVRNVKEDTMMDVLKGFSGSNPKWYKGRCGAYSGFGNYIQHRMSKNDTNHIIQLLEPQSWCTPCVLHKLPTCSLLLPRRCIHPAMHGLSMVEHAILLGWSDYPYF